MNKPLVLLVDDDTDILEFLTFALERDGFEVKSSTDGETAFNIAKQTIPDIIVLDMMMPGWDGLETCRHIRKEESLKNTMIVFLTARSEDYMQVEGLDTGADDYIPKPVKPKVLISRLHAILRRKTDVPQNNNSIIELKDLTIDKDNYTVVSHGKTMTLPKKEFELLLFLVTHTDKIHTRDEIYSAVWGDEVIVGERTIDVHIKKLRDKLQTDKIKTYKGIGYKYEE
mgnify:FL=1